MNTLKTYTGGNLPGETEETAIALFLHQHLEEFGDALEDIQLAIDYALSRHNKPGGSIIALWNDNLLTGAVVLNKTGMTGYIPDNILVYIATHNAHRGRGIGKQLMKRAIEDSEGDIALHVEPGNPAKRLYDSLGFTNKYLEMRLKK